jgi:lipoate-protein ligase A
VTRRRPSGWRVERSTGTAAALLEPWPPPDEQGDPVVRLSRVRGRALVLGSTQDAALVDRGRAGSVAVDVVRRSTGGGAVLVDTDAQVWIDLWLPRGHDRWDDDIIDAALWVGDTWVQALEGLGAEVLAVHRGPLAGTAWSGLVCFAGLGPGEVTANAPTAGVGAGQSQNPGPKVMGLAQRRSRAGARFHTTAPLSWDPLPLLDLLTVGVDATVRSADDRGHPDTGLTGALLADVAVGLRGVVPGWQGLGSDDDLVTVVEEAVLSALP